jgi:hypothetical protein
MLCVAFGGVKTLGDLKILSKLYQHFRERDLPYGLQDSLPTLNLSCSLCNFHGSATGPRLDTGGWLALTMGITPSLPDRDFHPAR